jgi:hypothetical protein
MRRVLVLSCLAAVIALAVAAPDGGAARGQWVWSPGLCKSYLKAYGVQISDGRVFHVSDAFCVGRGGLQHCQWTSASHTKRLYDEFLVVVRSPDGTVRRAELYTSGKKDYELEQIRLIGHEGSSLAFTRFVTPIATAAAKAEQGKGCAEP